MNTKLIAVLDKPVTYPSRQITFDLKRLFARIDQSLAMGASPVAASDADGTLWPGDMGSAFLQHIIRNNLLPGRPEVTWTYYMDMLENQGADVALPWRAKILKGIPLATVREWAQAAFDYEKPDVFPEMKAIIEHLQKKGVAVYIVTASVQWSIEPAAKMLGIPRENIIGIKTKVIDGIITDQLDGPITSKTGKVLGLLERNGGKEAFICFGNSHDDLALLESATHIKVIERSAEEGNMFFNTELKLLQVALEKGWRIFNRVNNISH